MGNKTLTDSEEYKVIPPNYNYWSSKIRNFIETGVMSGIIIFILYKLDKGFKFNAYALLMLVPILVFGIMGINEQSLLTALVNFVKFKKNRRTLGKPTAEYIRAKDKAMLKKKQKELKRGGKR